MTPEPAATPTTFSTTCNSESSRTDHDRFLPNSNDPIKWVKLRFIFLQREGDEDAGVGGFHLSNPEHAGFIEATINTMNWKMRTLNEQTSVGGCSGPDFDTKIQYDVESINWADNYYWNNQNGDNDGDGNSCDSNENCPGNNDWYGIPLHNAINAMYPEKRINVFFTENESGYNDAVAGIAWIGCHFDCSMYPSSTNIASSSGLRVHMLDEYNYFSSKRDDLVFTDPDYFWLANPPTYDSNNLWEWAKSILVNVLLHELGHSLDLPHTSPDFVGDTTGWPYFETVCNLMCANCLTNPTSISLTQIKTMHKALSVTNAREYVAGCPIMSQAFEITTDEIWDYDIRMYQDIIVKAGATLTLTCRVLMPTDARIIVERGGKLVIDGATITNACEDTRWKGIEVWGNSNKEHIADVFGGTAPTDVSAYEGVILAADDPGMVIFKENAVIENANNAIATYNSIDLTPFYDPDYFGGIIYAENTEFRNNNRSVEFMQYKPNNASRFINTTFDYTAAVTNPESHIRMWDVHGIVVDACTFRGNNNPAEGGIYSINAGYSLPKDNLFQDLAYGIYAISSGNLEELSIGNPDATSYNDTEENQFIHCELGIYIAGMDGARIMGNYFEDCAVGAYNAGSSRPRIHYNLFEATTTTNSFHGIVNLQSGNAPYEINQNTFVNTRSGIYNWLDNEGVTLKCNENVDVGYNIVVTGDYTAGGVSGKIAENQGENIPFDNTSPASNKFTISCLTTSTHIHTQGITETFNYVHHTNMDYIPICDAGANYTKEPHTESHNSACFPGDTPDDCPEPPCDDLLDDLSSEKSTLQNLQSNFPVGSFAYNELEKDIQQIDYKEGLVLGKTVEYYKEQDDIATAVNLLSQKQSDYADREKIQLLIAENNYTATQTALDALSQVTNADIQFKNLAQLHLNLKQAGNGWQDISTTQRTDLETIANSQTPASFKAQSIIQLLDNTLTMPTIPTIVPSSNKNTTSNVYTPNEQLVLTPNPVKDKLYISINDLADKDNLLVQIYNVQGRLIYQETTDFNHTVVSTTNFNEGLYFCIVVQNGATITQSKFSVIK